MSAVLGAGMAPIGSAYAGFGSLVVTSPGGAAFQLANGSQGTGRFIDPSTKDYQIDENGRFVGTPTAQQLVYLAIATLKGSSAQFNLGNKLSEIKTISERTKPEVFDEIASALAGLIKNNVIDLNNVDIQREGDSRIRVRIAWTDLASSVQYVTYV